MAEQNQQSIDAVDETVLDSPGVETPIVPEASPVLGPSTPENQIMTQEALDEQTQAQKTAEEARKARLARARAEIASRTRQGIRASEPSSEELLDELDRQEALEAQQAQLAEQQKLAEQQDLNSRIEQRKANIARAARHGLTLDRDEELDPLIERRDQEEIAFEDQIQQEQEDTALRILEAQTPDEAEIEAAAAPIRKQKANQLVEQKQQAFEKQEEQKIKQSADTRLAELDQRIEALRSDELDPQRFWNNMSLGGKIVAALSMFLGGYAAGMTGGRNSALEIIQGAVDKDLDAQKQQRKLELDEIEAKREEYYRMMNNKLEEQKQKTQNELTQMRIQDLQSQIVARQEKAMLAKQQLAESKARQDMLNSSGITEKTIPLLDEKQRERLVRKKDGTYSMAFSKEAATELRKFKNDVEPAQDAIKRAIMLSKQGTRFSLEDRAKLATEMQGIIGNLRLSFLGPGAMTEQEYTRLRDTLGNPNKLFALPSVERKKLETVFNKLNSDLKSRYENAGIRPPVSKREKLIEKQIKMGRQRADVESTIDSLIESGKLSQDFAL